MNVSAVSKTKSIDFWLLLCRGLELCCRHTVLYHYTCRKSRPPCIEQYVALFIGEPIQLEKDGTHLNNITYRVKQTSIARDAPARFKFLVDMKDARVIVNMGSIVSMGVEQKGSPQYSAWLSTLSWCFNSYFRTWSACFLTTVFPLTTCTLCSLVFSNECCCCGLESETKIENSCIN